MKISKTFILITALILSLLYNLYATFLTDMHFEGGAGYADRELPLGGIEIDEETATSLITRYEDANKGKTRGFQFSRKVFETIFKGDDNTIALYLIGDDPTKLYMILKGYKTNNTGVTELLGSNIYMGQATCPLDCCEW